MFSIRHEEKVTKKLDSEIVRTTDGGESETQNHVSDNTFTSGPDNVGSSNEQTEGGALLANISKKKKQYLEQQIVDRSGNYDYREDPNQYKKARKRLQNRESAVRSRQKKRNEMDLLED